MMRSARMTATRARISDLSNRYKGTNNRNAGTNNRHKGTNNVMRVRITVIRVRITLWEGPAGLVDYATHCPRTWPGRPVYRRGVLCAPPSGNSPPAQPDARYVRCIGASCAPRATFPGCVPRAIVVRFVRHVPSHGARDGSACRESVPRVRRARRRIQDPRVRAPPHLRRTHPHLPQGPARVCICTAYIRLRLHASWR
jgi:hypothetical protein